jgi:hypothetical protein
MGSIFRAGDSVLVDQWKPQLKQVTKYQYKIMIQNFVKTSKIDKIANYVDYKFAVQWFLHFERKKHKNNFDLGIYIETLQKTMKYFRWFLGFREDFAKLKKDLALVSKYNTAAKKEKARQAYANLKKSDPEYANRQAKLQQSQKIKNLKNQWARNHQGWPSDLMKISDQVRQRATGCVFKGCNCQKVNFYSKRSFITLLNSHHKLAKEDFPELRLVPENQIPVCLPHHLWLEAMTEGKVNLIRGHIISQLIFRTRIFTVHHRPFLRHRLMGIISSVAHFKKDPTLKNLQETHILISELNSVILNVASRSTTGRTTKTFEKLN